MKQRRRLCSSWFGYGLAMLACACSGSIEPEKDSVPANGQGGQAGSSKPANGGGGPSPGLDPRQDESLSCDQPSVATSPLRRLTNPEYDRTVQDLFVGFDVGTPSRDFGFPADSFGGNFSNDAARHEIVRALAEGYFEASGKLAGLAAAAPDKLLGCDLVKDEAACTAKLFDGFALRAFRRPLSTGERDRLTSAYQQTRATDGVPGALTVVIQRILMSPQFLYRIEPPAGALRPNAVDKLDDWQIGSRLSYLITGTMPDEELFAAARKGELAKVDGIVAHAKRLLDKPSARAVARRFFREWLDFGLISGVTREADAYPGFDAALAKDMLEQAERLAERVFFDSKEAMADLWTSPRVVTNDRLSRFLGLPAGGADFAAIDGDPQRNLGFLTNAAILAVSSHGDERKKSIFRGKWVRNRVLCQELPAPPADIPALPKFDPNASSREQLNTHLTSASCQTCHRLIDPAGFAFQHYDAAGRWTDRDGPRAVDATGELVEAGDASGKLDGVTGLSKRLATSEAVRSCVTREMFRFSVGRFEGDADACSLRDLRRRFTETGSFREAIVALVATDAFRHQRLAE